MDIDTLLAIAYGVLLVVLGFNALIIVHEFGHFAVARLCGVKCEKFYLFFDFWGLRLCRFKWGDTEYGVGLFPLGGYVKMLGQEDDPGAMRAEIEKAKMQSVASTSTPDSASPPDSALPVETTASASNNSSSFFAPDSYLSKTVPQRFAIIVAGVVMNFLFAIVCAAGAYMYGVNEITPAVGGVIPGSPAWEAGLLTGDRIVAIDEKPARAFGDVLKKMVEGKRSVKIDIERQVDGEVIPMSLDVAPRRRSGDLTPNIGILSMPSMQLLSGLVHPVGREYYPASTLALFAQHTEMQPLFLEKVDGQTVKSFRDYQEAQLTRIGQPILCTFNGADVMIPAIAKREIPVRFQMGTIAAVLPGSDAELQGITPGDVIVSVDGDHEIDPLKLPQVLLHKVNAGQQSVELTIAKADGEKHSLTLELAPIRILPELSAMSMRDPVGSNAVGLSWNVEPIIAAVDVPHISMPTNNGQETEGQSAEGQSIVGSRVIEVEFVNSNRLLRRTSFSRVTQNGFLFHSVGNDASHRIGIPYIFSYLLQDAQLADKRASRFSALLGEPPAVDEGNRELFVRLTLESPDKIRKVVDFPIQKSTDWFNTERGFGLQTETELFIADGLGDALGRGSIRVFDFSLLIYRSVSAIINGTVSTRALNGPVGIIELMYRIARSGWSEYLMFLCLVGANLAVINLLPMPPLDGGHLVFLTYEGVVQRPPNEMIQVVLSYLGLLLIIVLMVWTISLDLTCIPRW